MNEMSRLPAGPQVASLSVEAEQQVLGAILLDNSLHSRVADMLLAEHFGDPVHADIYRAMAARIMRGHLVSPVTMKVALEAHEGLAQLGGPAYLVRMAGASFAPAATIREYARTVVDLAARRALQEAAQGAIEGCRVGVDTLEVKAGLLSALQRVPEASGEESTVSLIRAFTGAMDTASKAYEGLAPAFLKLGIPALDAVLGGLGPGDYMLLGGASSMGKTSVALEIASRVAIDQKRGVVFVSLEMSKEQLATRIASAASRIPYAALRNPEKMEEASFRKWIEAGMQASTSAPLRIVPKHVRDIAAIHAACMRAKGELGDAGLALVVVDYAQLVRGHGKGRYEQMTDVSIGLKTLAGMMDCPVIALVQIDRGIGEREDKRPQMTDIRESGQFENDADQVVFCYREEYYLARRGPKPNKDGNITTESQADWEAEMERSRNVMELIVRKNRHGGLGTVKVGFHQATNRFWPLEERSGYEP